MGVEIKDLKDMIRHCEELPNYLAAIIFRNHRDRANLVGEWCSRIGTDWFAPNVNVCMSDPSQVISLTPNSIPRRIIYENGSTIELCDAIDTRTGKFCGCFSEILISEGADINEDVVWSRLAVYRANNYIGDISSQARPTYDTDDEPEAQDASLDDFLAMFIERTIAEKQVVRSAS